MTDPTNSKKGQTIVIHPNSDPESEILVHITRVEETTIRVNVDAPDGTKIFWRDMPENMDQQEAG